MIHDSVFIHDTARVDRPANIGKGSKIWHYTHVMKSACIGKNCVLGQNVNVGSKAVLGNNVKVQNNVSIYDSVILEDSVFCGPSMVFTNVINPRAFIERKSEYKKTLVRRGATLGANCTVVCGCEIGKYAMVGAGAVVTGDVPEYALMLGVPARVKGWVCKCGVTLDFPANPSEQQSSICVGCKTQYIFTNNRPEPVLIERSIDMSKVKNPKGNIIQSEPIDEVKLLDLQAQFKQLKPEIMKAVEEVFDSQYFINGPKVADFEKKCADYCGCAQAIGVSSGSDAILLVLMALGIGPGDEVITSPFTFFSTAGAIQRVGARPVFADIKADSFNIDPDKIDHCITDKTKAIIPVHLFGQCAEMEPILEIAEKNGIPVIEDAAQAIGSEYKGKRAGSMGLAGCFSFFPSKNLGGAGDGGLVTTNDPEFAEKLRIFRNHGSKPKYYHKFVGGNFRLDALQASVLDIKLEYLDSWSDKRAINADMYRRLFKEQGLFEKGLKTPEVMSERRHIYNQFCILIPKNRDILRDNLRSCNIGCEVYYPVPLHLQECFEFLGYKRGDFPVSEAIAKQILAVPIYPELSEQHISHVVEMIKNLNK